MSPQSEGLRERSPVLLRSLRTCAPVIIAHPHPDTINAAFGLTPDEVKLMWDTAPFRMPIAPPTVG